MRECSSHYMCHVSCVMCHVSRVTFHVSHVTCNFIFLFLFIYFYLIFIYFLKLDNGVELVGGGSIISGAYPVRFSVQCTIAEQCTYMEIKHKMVYITNLTKRSCLMHVLAFHQRNMGKCQTHVVTLKWLKRG